MILDLVSGQITRLTVPDLRAVDFVAWVGSDEWLATRPLGERGSEILHVNRAGMVKVLWRDSSILLRRLTVSPDGTRGEALKVADTSAARASGFPRLAAWGDELILAWRDVAEPPRVRTAVVTWASSD